MAERILDWDKYIEKAAEVCADGIVMLKNDNGALPVSRDDTIAVFGRIQLDYYKSGTGSGGMVNVSKVTGVIDGLEELGAKLDTELLETYRSWTAENPFELGESWGGEPWSQKEMPLTDELVSAAASRSDTAVVIIGRTAGEEQDNTADEGSFLLSQGERDMLAAVRKHFRTMTVLLNVGNTIDMSFVDDYSPDAVLYIWQGGMTGGLGAAKVILGDVSPSGRLPDTIAYSITDHPSDRFFYGRERDVYGEDIFVGYRYFETFAKDMVRYPFGYGLSYTDFAVKASGSFDEAEGIVTITAEVTNRGSFGGKHSVLVYCAAPQGSLGKPAKVLCGFDKTATLAPDESETLTIIIPVSAFASYDDSGASGHHYAWLLEKGCYRFYVGGDVRSAPEVFEFEIFEDVVTEQLKQALAPVTGFERMVGGGDEPRFEAVPLSQIDETAEREAALPDEITPTEGSLTLADAVNGSCTLDEFVAQLSDDDLCCLVRGEGMCSPKVTPGTAAAFGGVSESLSGKGVPCGCCSDGPSGMRLDCGTKAFSLPNGTLIASTFDRKLTEELFGFTGLEMTANNVDCLLGPGMNIHRHPLNGRNFEYFSEDPFLTGHIAAAELKGLHGAGVEGTIKHFCANNQETNRRIIDSAVSERALREIYLRGFEIAVREGGARSIMTTYGQVNGLWTAGSFGLNTSILRGEWGFDGFVMTDWWADINRRGCAPDKQDLAAMVSAQNDVYMVCADSEHNPDNLKASLADGSLKRCELQRSAKNILSFLMTTHAMERMTGTGDTVKVINKPDDGGSENVGNEVFDLDGKAVIDLTSVKTGRNSEYSFTFDVRKTGMHRFTLTASSKSSKTAQMNVTIYSLGTAVATFTYNGTDGEPVSFTSGDVPLFSRYSIIRLHFSLGGLDLISLEAENVQPF
ncbi:beta-glucosidase [Ruminococcus sp. YE71]|uniref:glycoside hydrolase family 3 protein n=1 Tax=unclassified Ruminococcus TaxID=2608920 RepID=UPI00088A9EBF|nr:MULTISPECIES: glycoside hydrolase family 3 protein [unclassified Ruminococcus]SDA13480.1 beta-glucosidase [Ruminococcus sp. YE78]SFW19164.1 beta-glucosidase [Ruminococcus sp. YE71]